MLHCASVGTKLSQTQTFCKDLQGLKLAGLAVSARLKFSSRRLLLPELKATKHPIHQRSATGSKGAIQRFMMVHEFECVVPRLVSGNPKKPEGVHLELEGKSYTHHNSQYHKRPWWCPKRIRPLYMLWCDAKYAMSLWVLTYDGHLMFAFTTPPSLRTFGWRGDLSQKPIINPSRATHVSFIWQAARVTLSDSYRCSIQTHVLKGSNNAILEHLGTGCGSKWKTINGPLMGPQMWISLV